MQEETQAVYGIIGNPVSHSLSPVMHNTAFRALDVNAVYKLFQLEKVELEDFFEKMHDDDSPIFGLNVTVPYKEDVIPYMDVLTPLAQKLGAVNTIMVNHERKLIGYNTDAPGFIAHLKELGFNTEGKRIAILGAGGSCRAILGTLCMIPERPESIKIYKIALELEPSNPAINHNYGTTLYHVGKPEEALKYLLKSKELGSDNKRTDEWIEGISKQLGIPVKEK
jgi:shikimate 5-dehydrogenase